MNFEAGHEVYAESQLDADKWKDGDRDDDLITFAFNRTPGLCMPAPDNENGRGLADVDVIETSTGLCRDVFRFVFKFYFM